MNRLARVAILGLASLLGLFAGPAAAEWRRYDSEHFALYTRRQEASSRDLVKQLEYLHWLGQKYMGNTGPTQRSKARFTIYEVAGRSELHDLFEKLHDQADGVYTFCAEGSVAYTVPGKAYDGFISWGQTVLQHEYAHHLMFQYASVTYPPWFVEGFAEFLSQTAVDSNRLVVGAVNSWRLRELSRGWMPMEDVLGWQRLSAAQRDADNDSFYAQSWLLTHYMLIESDRAARLPGYFERIGQGEDPKTAFESVFGLTMAQLRLELTRHLRRMPTLEIPLSSLPVPSVANAPLPADATEYLLDESRLRSCAGKDLGATILKRLRAHATSSEASPEAKLALARAEMLYGDSSAARALLEPMLEKGAGNAELQYLTGRTWAKLAETLSGDEQRDAWSRARSALIQAYKLRKDDAPTLYHLARVLERGGIDSNVLNAARTARTLAPAVPDYAFLELRLDLEAGERELAIRTLGPMAINPHAGAYVERTRQAIAAIRAGKPAAEVLGLLEEPKKEAKP